MTKVVDASKQSDLQNAARALKSGLLVAFPTETVYGLGADAGNSDAIAMVFSVKGRPSSDPLIVHCLSFEQSQHLVSPTVNQWQRDAHQCLAEVFWPGPLTLILPCNSERVASNVTGGTGWVGLRCPNHPVAIAFLSQCNVPVAAPSANVFGHVSPTCAQHVLADFPNVDNLWIVDGGECGLGIESTVVRINAEKSIDILRRGGVGKTQIEAALVNAGIFENLQNASDHVHVVEKYISHEKTTQPLAAPGQLLVHYAPRLKTHMVHLTSNVDSSDFQEIERATLSKTIVIDFGGALKSLSVVTGYYRDLSASASAQEAAHQLFSLLRWAEDQASDGSDDWQIWIQHPLIVGRAEEFEMLAAVADRVFRAASGKSADVCVKQDSDRVFFSVR